MANFWHILQYYSQYWKSAVFSIIASSCFEILDLAVPYTIGQIINLISKQPLDGMIRTIVGQVAAWSGQAVTPGISLGVLLGLIFLFTVAKSPVQPWCTAWFQWDVPLRARRDQTIRTIAKILSLPLDFYDENNPGRIASRVSRGLENHTWAYTEIAGQLIPKAVRVLGIFGLLCVVEWRIAAFFVISFTIVLSITLRSLNQLIAQEGKLARYMENTESRTSEIITNIKTVKAFSTEASELKRQQQRLQREFTLMDYRIHRGFVQLLTWQRSIIQLSLFTVLAMILLTTFQGQMSLGYAVTALTIASMAYGELEPISHLAESFARRYSAMSHYQELMQTPIAEEGTVLARLHQAAPVYQFSGKIHFDNVVFGYEADKPILKGIQALIEPYQTVAIVGRSGSGKSTLVKLLFRYFEPQSGAILIDGQDIRSLDASAYRKRLAIVHQEVDVFNGTILENLTYGNPTASFAEIQGACRIAQAEDFIQQLPEGFYTIVGERGVRLSGGQRQRLGIARALLVNPDVLVFDEATSSLDYESERAIQLAMRNIFGTRTTIIIAHRLSTIREADQIVVLDQGQIVEVGSHESLLSQQGIYHRLHKLQETGELLP